MARRKTSVLPLPVTPWTSTEPKTPRASRSCARSTTADCAAVRVTDAASSRGKTSGVSAVRRPLVPGDGGWKSGTVSPRGTA